MKVKKAVVGRVRMLERPPRSDEGQLGQSIPQPVVAAAMEREREKTRGNGGRRLTAVEGARVQRQGRRGWRDSGEATVREREENESEGTGQRW